MSTTITLSTLNQYNTDMQTEFNKINPATNYQKSNYQMQTIQWILSIYKYLFWIYIAVAGVLAGCIYMYTPYNIYIKIFLAAVFLLFPFYILKLEQFIYSIFTFIYSLFTSTIYTNVYFNHY